MKAEPNSAATLTSSCNMLKYLNGRFAIEFNSNWISLYDFNIKDSWILSKIGCIVMAEKNNQDNIIKKSEGK